ncbi:hypothetical protein BZA05DRAFT_117342, partial [Tricharina praecox]|uniref:uncharacterized protein n=1 Tax=Tricharina praecox TaxID=43433 RepID=UPI00221EC766
MSKVHTSLAKATPPATPPLHLQSKSTSLPSNFSTSTTPTTTTTTAIPPPPPPPPLQQPPSPPPPPPPPASSLPPRPPPTQAVPRKSSPTSIAPIIPALPMALVAQRGSKKSYPPPGIGRGHSSLPPKPGFVSKPLPRDTEAIVLTSGGDSLSFAAPPKGKRTYSSVASETTMRPMDPAVTNLTPQNIVSPSAPAPSHHTAPVHTAVPTAPQPRSLTPPAEPTVKKIMAGKELQDLGNLSVVGFTPTPP